MGQFDDLITALKAAHARIQSTHPTLAAAATQLHHAHTLFHTTSHGSHNPKATHTTQALNKAQAEITQAHSLLKQSETQIQQYLTFLIGQSPATTSRNTNTTETDTVARVGGNAGFDGADSRSQTIECQIDSALAEHQEIASIIKKLMTDINHPLNVTDAIGNPDLRDETLAKISELAQGRLLAVCTLEEYCRDNPGLGPLFEQFASEINTTLDGQGRKDVYVAESKRVDPVRSINSNLDSYERGFVYEYARRLQTDVHPVARSEVAALATKFDGAMMNIRTKDSEAIFNKVGRMTTGSDTRLPRPGYQVGDVIDAVGARITACDTKQLGELLHAVKEYYGIGDGGRILEVENMYAAPKSASPEYRVIALVVATEVNGCPYTYELQLATRRASIAADLYHNTIYKPYVELSSAERGKISGIFAEAAALDQEETRRSTA